LLDVAGTISGKTLIVSGNASVTGSLVVKKSISGAALEVLGTASGLNLYATQSVTGTHLYAATTFAGKVVFEVAREERKDRKVEAGR
jgi:cytoskeletal protein CcmA (bactofilin family)